MADYSTNLDPILQSQSQKEATANALFDPASLAMVFGRRASTCAALTWGYYGGRVNGTAVANGTVAATASTTNYVVVHRTTFAVSISTATTNWNDNTTYGRAYKLTAGASSITDWEDHRFSTDGTGIFDVAQGGGGTVPTGTGFRHVTSGAEDAAAVAVDLSSAHATGILAAARFPALTGDVTTSSGAVATTIANDAVTNAKAANMANATIKGRTTAGTGDPEDLTAAQVAAILGTNVKSTESIILAVTDETTSITAAVAKMRFRMPYAFTITAVRASLTTAQASGSIFTVDINETGTSILSTKLTIDNTETTSTTAATPPVISDSAIADDAEISVDVDQIGDGTATGLKVALIGNRA